MTSQLYGFSVKIADVVIRSTSDDVALEPAPQYKPFIVNDSKPDIDIKAYCRGIPNIKRQQKIFDAGGSWSLYTWPEERYLFAFTTPIVKPNLYEIAIFSKDFTHGEIHYRRVTTKWPGPRDPLNYPLDELMMVNYLAQGRGIDIHALGVASDSTGLAFVGVSGAGKSTMAELWKKRDVKLLSDDRIILRKDKEVFWMHGTPWHGDARVSLAERVPLHSLYFLKQARTNNIIPVKPADAATRLMVRCFPPLYFIYGMEFTLEFISELVQKVRCYELQFTPDQRAVDEVLDHVKRISP